tara:strand:- start:529 stop:1233 length:705 start_codon:yes stop_codon:yes gene_type:complete
MLGLANSITGGVLSGFEPTSVSNLSMWLKNDTGITAAKWEDQSGNDNFISQSSTGDQATVTAGGYDFEGDQDDHYDIQTAIDLGTTNAFTVFVVVKLESYDSQNTLLSVTSGNDRFLEFQNADQMRYRQSGTTAVLKFEEEGMFPLTTKMLITFNKHTDRNIRVYKNGTILTQGESTGVPVGSGAFLANQFGGRSSGPDRDFDGIIYEFLLYEATLSAGDLSDMHDYLTTKHGL